jgi:hypothetical protein
MVTVTGRSLRSTAASLEECLARHCAPGEDIAASLEHAENQFIAGEIQGARTTLIKPRSRNKRYAETLPREVSGLLQLDADVASLLGLSDYGRIATFDSVDALKAGLPADDPAISIKRLEVADVFLRQGKYSTAVHMYDAVARRAEELGWPQVQGSAMLRALRFYAMTASVNPAYGGESRSRYAALSKMTDPAVKPMQNAALVILARLHLLSKKNADVDAVMEKLANIKVSIPVLVYSPFVDLGKASPAMAGYVTPAASEDQWADFSYRISSEGTVKDVVIAARGPHVEDGLVKRMENSVAGRRYVPLDLPSGSDGIWRRERLMVVADVVPVTGSRVKIKAGRPTLMSMDLTAKVKVTP